MLPGYNHNVQYKGTIYHIQTEDSGVVNPHIITLLYEKGNILSRKKTSYQDILKSDRLNAVVKELMQEQHKSMLRDLRKGMFDEKLGLKPAAKAEAKPVEAVQPPEPRAKIEEPSVPPPPVHKEGAKILELSDDKELSDEDIFGADLISDKSLDEVILNYLATDSDSGGDN